jgi:adenosylcobinamide-GDP ribazoletransferase
MAFLLALRFLTRIPVPLADEREAGAGPASLAAGRAMASDKAGSSSPAYGWAMAWFPSVGLLIGMVLAVVRWVAGLALGPALASALTLAAWVAITGGLHLDGAVDCFDALVVAAPAERRLAILRDVHVGAYGVVGAALLLLVKWLAIVEAPWPALLAAPVLGRLALVYVVYAFDYARPDGMGSAFKQILGTRQVLVAAGTALACVLVLGTGGAGGVTRTGFCDACIASQTYSLATGTWRGALVIGVSWAAAWAVGAWAGRQLGGGITGDVYGLACEVVEVVALLAWGALYAAA